MVRIWIYIPFNVFPFTRMKFLNCKVFKAFCEKDDTILIKTNLIKVDICFVPDYLFRYSYSTLILKKSEAGLIKT